MDDGVEVVGDKTYRVQTHKARKGIPVEKVEAELARGGELPLHVRLRKQVGYLSAGFILGRREFVEDFYQKHRDKFGPQRKEGAKPLGWQVGGDSGDSEESGTWLFSLRGRGGANPGLEE